jgi:uncharacterized membrane protein
MNKIQERKSESGAATNDRRYHCQTCLEVFDAEDRPRLARVELVALVGLTAIVASLGTWFLGAWAVVGLLALGILGCVFVTVLALVSAAKEDDVPRLRQDDLQVLHRLERSVAGGYWHTMPSPQTRRLEEGGYIKFRSHKLTSPESVFMITDAGRKAARGGAL